MYFSLLLSLFFLPPESQVEITPITHSSVVLTWQNKTIYVDPWSIGIKFSLPNTVPGIEPNLWAFGSAWFVWRRGK